MTTPSTCPNCSRVLETPADSDAPGVESCPDCGVTLKPPAAASPDTTEAAPSAAVDPPRPADASAGSSANDPSPALESPAVPSSYGVSADRTPVDHTPVQVFRSPDETPPADVADDASLSAEERMAVVSCPSCQSPLRLLRALHGRKIRCATCQTVLSVTAEPWMLTVVENRKPDGQPAGPAWYAAAVADPHDTASSATLAEWKVRLRFVSRGDRFSSQWGWTPVATPSPPSIAKIVSASAFTLAVAVILVVGLIRWQDLDLPSNSVLRFMPAQAVEIHTVDVAAWLSSIGGEVPHGDALRPASYVSFNGFLSNAKLSIDDVARVGVATVSGSARRVLIFQMRKPVDHKKLMAQNQFQMWNNQKQKLNQVHGVPVYVLDTDAFAFPDQNVILSGEKDAVEEMAGRGSRAPRALAAAALATDFSAPEVVLRSRATVSPSVAVVLSQAKSLGSALRGVAEETTYGTRLHHKRTLLFTRAQDAALFGAAFDRTLAQAKRDVKGGESMKDTIASIRRQQSGDRFIVEWDEPGSVADHEVREWLKGVLN